MNPSEKRPYTRPVAIALGNRATRTSIDEGLIGKMAALDMQEPTLAGNKESPT
eukprot:Awhi_evm1s2560